MPEPLVTTKVVADFLGLKSIIIIRYIDQEGLPAYCLRGGKKRTFRFRLSEIKAWLDKRHINVPPNKESDVNE
ncbi:hypothetical protein ES703_38575 [subsurface metagenome]